MTARRMSSLLVRDPLDLRNVDSVFRQRFWSKVDVQSDGDCWTWIASKSESGYGQFYIRKGVPVTAHRVALALSGHVLTRDLSACHTCDNPPCVNPNHLFVGTQRDNAIDSVRKGRAVRSFGENHRSARLTANVVADLRSNAPYSYGDYSRLGREYGCTSNAIRRAVLGITWRHL